MLGRAADAGAAGGPDPVRECLLWAARWKSWEILYSSCGIVWRPLNFNCINLFERKADALEPGKIRTLEEIKEELKKLLVENLSLEDLKPEDIKDDADLFGESGIGLDSLDGVEIVVLLRRQYGLDVKAMQKGRDVFRSINTLAPYVLANATK